MRFNLPFQDKPFDVVGMGLNSVDCCFTGPAARMQLKKLDLTVQFKMEPRADPPLSPDDQAWEAIQ